MKIGYARVSTRDQNLDLQIDALRQAGCTDTYIYKEHFTGSSKERPQLKKLLEQVREGDIIVTWKLDRLGRSLTDLVQIVNEIEGKGAGLLFIKNNIDTTTIHGKLFFHIFAAISEFEREIIRERTNAGLASARARGRKGGRPPGLSKEAQVEAAAATSLYQQKKSVAEICNTLTISKKTFYKYLKVRYN
ncbi:MAG: recombinase family protein [Saprospiraceae bacterium]